MSVFQLTKRLRIEDNLNYHIYSQYSNRSHWPARGC